MCCNGLLSQIPRLGDIEVRMVESLHAVTKVGGVGYQFRSPLNHQRSLWITTAIHSLFDYDYAAWDLFERIMGRCFFI